MKMTLLFLAFAAISFSSVPLIPTILGGMFRGSGKNANQDLCAGCAILIHFVTEVADYHESTIIEGFEFICKILPEKERKTCEDFVYLFGPIIIEMLEEEENIDDICLKIGFCTDSRCRIYSDSKDGVPITYHDIPDYSKYEPQIYGKWEPYIDDKDGDKFSTYRCLRGSAFRGKDCDDEDNTIYPGKKVDNRYDKDYNCNGISGKDESGTPYMEKFCKGTNPRGIAVIGDSVCAHFRIPSIWISPKLPEWGECEMDWPYLGAYVGYEEDFTGLTPGKVSSIYQHALSKNLCNHRDYQDVCVNGARSSVLKDLVRSLARNPDTDYPMTLFINLVGDDVCSGHPFWYTKPEDWRNHILDGLDYLDTILPNNSYIAFIGFVDGRVLYDTLFDEEHPAGATYAKVYEYLNCLNISMCWGWCNNNATIRNITTEAAEKLNVETLKIVANQKYKHFEMMYIPFDGNMLMDRIEAEGYKRKDAIEPMDGFHPSQISQHVFSQYIIEEVEKVWPDAFGEVNPNNNEIKKVFGDQGGY